MQLLVMFHLINKIKIKKGTVIQILSLFYPSIFILLLSNMRETYSLRHITQISHNILLGFGKWWT